MISPPRIAIVGVGSIGSRHINTLLAMGYKDLVGVDPRLMPHEERLPVISAFCDLEPWKPTHALICSPPEWHYHHAKYFIDRGIPTFIEKPMTVGRVEASELCATAHIHKSLLAVGYMERAHPLVKSARRYMKGEAHTKKKYAERYAATHAFINCHWKATPKTYRLDVLAESSHALDTVQYIFGEINRAQVKFRSTTSCTIELLCNGEIAVYVSMDMDAAYPQRHIAIYSNDDVYSVRYGRTAEEWDACYEEELHAFLNGNPLCTGEDGLRVVEILEEMK